jgi:H/ACA ribonucleoprotein complex subunit 1
MNQVYFTVKPAEGIVATSFKKGDKVFVGGDKLLPLERFLPKPKGPSVKRPGGRGRGGGADRGRGRGGGFSRGGRGGGFTPRGGSRGGFGARGGGVRGSRPPSGSFRGGRGRGSY